MAHEEQFDVDEQTPKQTAFGLDLDSAILSS